MTNKEESLSNQTQNGSNENKRNTTETVTNKTNSNSMEEKNLNGEDAQNLINNGTLCIGEISNMGCTPEAIDAFKQTISKYPNTSEAYSALDGMEQIYVETNNVAEYIAYTKTLNKMNIQSTTQEDSLIFVTAELQYMMQNYEQAAAGLATYLTRFCPGGRYCVNAMHYAANSYYMLEQYEQAKEQYMELTKIDGNPYMEKACMRVAEISYDQKDYSTALTYFERMYAAASDQNMAQTALLGMMRCSHYINNNDASIKHATSMLALEDLSNAIYNEALYYRASAYLNNKQYSENECVEIIG